MLHELVLLNRIALEGVHTVFLMRAEDVRDSDSVLGGQLYGLDQEAPGVGLKSVIQVQGFGLVKVL